eukprot:124729-Pyramimonas_sp.AAC.1
MDPPLVRRRSRAHVNGIMWSLWVTCGDSRSLRVSPAPSGTRALPPTKDPSRFQSRASGRPSGESGRRRGQAEIGRSARVGESGRSASCRLSSHPNWPPSTSSSWRNGTTPLVSTTALHI